jgi:hypothetical protein
MPNSAVRKSPLSRWFLLAVALTTVCGVSLAQTPDLRPGNFELGLYAGASYGVDSFRPMGGVNLSYSLPKLLLPYAEFNYFPELSRSYNTATDHFNIAAQIEDVHAGVHIRILPHESRVVPYGVIGFGLLHSHTTGQDVPDASACIVQGIRSTPCTPAEVAQRTTPVDITANDPAVNFGAGLRIYHKSYLGYRVEYKLYRPVSGDFTKFFSKAEAGIFFQFGARR